jgi:Uma2 family endonuclease
MSTVTTTRMTVEEFYEWVHRPENANKWFELVRGEVIELPAPTKPHGAICMNVGRIVSTYTFQLGKGYVTSNDSGVLLERDPDTVRGPDVAYYEDADHFVDLHPKYGEHPPLLAVEVLSPYDRADSLIEKINVYLRTGVRLVWVVNPATRSVTIYQPDRPLVRLDESQELTGDPILPGFRCRVVDFFLLPADKAKGNS